MNKLFQLSLIILAIGSSAVTAEADLIASGTLSVSNGTLVRIPADSTAWPTTSVTWSVSSIEASDATYGSYAGNYLYEYHFSSEGTGPLFKELSHFSLEVSGTFTAANVLYASPTYQGLGIDPTSPSGIDGGSGGLFGLTWQVGSQTFSLVLISNRDPVWGDLFLKDGTVSAYNSGYFSADPTSPVTGANITGFGWLATPDTTEGGADDDDIAAPEPASLALFGLGALGMGLIARRRRSTSEVVA